MWRTLKGMYQELIRERPGRRFYARYRRMRSREQESHLAAALYVLLGVVVLLLGVVFSFWPVIPGFVFVLVGLAILSARSEFVARGLDKLEMTGRRLWAQHRNGRKNAG